jgi:hypothetical protein
MLSKKCRNCGSDLVDNAMYCDKCGTKTTIFCTSCGTILGDEYMFCPNCGHATGIRTTAAPTQDSQIARIDDHTRKNASNTEGQPTAGHVKGVFKSLWEGDIPLCKAYWIYFLLGQIIVYFSVSFLLGFLYGFLFSSYEPLIVKMSALFLIAYVVFSGIGVCRSAKKYSGNRLWRYLAYIAVILSILLNSRYFLNL